MVLVVASTGAAGCANAEAPLIPPGAPTTSDSGPATAVPSKTAPDAGSVKVVGYGYSRGKDKQGKPLVQYGIVLLNTSAEYVATTTQVHLTIADAQGRSVENRKGRATYRETPVIFPGERMGIGEVVRVDNPDAATMTVSIGTSAWLKPGSPIRVAEDGKLTPLAAIRVVNIRTRPPRVPSARWIDYTARSDYRRGLSDTSTQVIFRNGSGAIVGGISGSNILQVNDYKDRGEYLGPGTSSNFFLAGKTVPASTDDSRTEIYIFPFRTSGDSR